MRAVIQFSGGRDSLALAYHMRALTPFVDVVMVDTGDMPLYAYENKALVKSLGFNVHVVQTHPSDWRVENGQPDGSNWTVCCYRNIWLPMSEFIEANGYRQVIRGTRRCDPHFHGVMPGDIVDGVLYTFPLWDWTDKQVNDYLGPLLPEAYRNDVNGMPDCLTCPVMEACGGKNREVWNAS
mgnify:CR=1 FL=1